jgi:hypothetical protein
MEQLVARRAHNPKVVGSSPTPATISLINRIKIIDSVVRCIMEQLLDRRAQLFINKESKVVVFYQVLLPQPFLSLFLFLKRPSVTQSNLN